MSDKENEQPAPVSIPEIKAAAPVVRSNREVAQQKIADNEAEIVSTNQTLLELIRKRFDLNELLNSTSSFLSILPLDIITTIFMIVCEDEEEEEDADPLPTQFLLGRVCREWRRIVWSTPSLWNPMAVALSQSRFERQEPLIHEWIARTSPCPVGLYFLQSPKKSRKTKHVWDPPVEFFRRLLQSCNRWEIFQFSDPSVNLQTALKDPGDRQFPLLKSIIVNGREDFVTLKDEWKFNMPPMLEDIHVQCGGTFEMDVNWSSLKGFELAVSFNTLMQVLRACSTSESLEWIKLVIMEGGSEPESPNFTFKPPKLWDLNINGEAEAVGSLISISTFPALKNISMEVVGTQILAPRWPDHFIAMAHRSKFELEYLRIVQVNVAISEERLLDVLAMVPKLTYFVLENPPLFDLSDMILNRLTLNRYLSEPNLRPSERRMMKERSLEYLTGIHYTGPISFSLDVLYEFLKSRSPKEWIEDEDHENQPETNDSSSSDKAPSISPDNPFRADILYTNKSWFFEQNPSKMHTFYKKLEILPAIDLYLIQPNPV